MLSPVGSRYIYLDAGRGLAALVVLWHHVTVFYGKALERLFADYAVLIKASALVSELNVEAVMFFFFISGWSIAISVCRLTLPNGKTPWVTYLRHRARRILPIYWFSLLWSFALTASLAMPDQARSLLTLLGNLAFLQTSAAVPGSLVIPFAGNGPLWSLSYEVWYYLALPVLYLAVLPMVPPRLRSHEMAMISAMLIGPVAICLNWLLPNPLLQFATLWPVWLAGYIFAWAAGDRARETRCITIIAGGLLMLLAMSTVLRSATLSTLCAGLGVAAAIACLVILRELAPLQQFLRFKPIALTIRALARTGHGSYSLYILHYPLLLLLAGLDVGLASAALVVLGLVLASPTVETMLQQATARMSLFSGRVRSAGQA